MPGNGQIRAVRNLHNTTNTLPLFFGLITTSLIRIIFKLNLALVFNSPFSGTSVLESQQPTTGKHLVWREVTPTNRL